MEQRDRENIPIHIFAGYATFPEEWFYYVLKSTSDFPEEQEKDAISLKLSVGGLAFYVGVLLVVLLTIWST